MFNFIYLYVLKIICTSYDIDLVKLLSCNTPRCVDARYIFVESLARYYSDGDISSLSGLSRSTVVSIRNRIKDHKFSRASCAIRKNVEKLLKTLMEKKMPCCYSCRACEIVHVCTALNAN